MKKYHYQIIAIGLCLITVAAWFLYGTITQQRRQDLIKATLFGFGASVSLVKEPLPPAEFGTNVRAAQAKLPSGCKLHVTRRFDTNPPKLEAMAYVEDEKLGEDFCVILRTWLRLFRRGGL